ncbi:hypothetical protein PsorP6_004910 [Peronosclerospora sorghi]|uniref:Uncharacterized protein n=1 Tax=Peronosclerospora sorghi TaxID=230839 RepID=A0ACC0W3K1_9STRA|nr:hypothetical protein PsorP6_004910 [Peronosclerospora sorghi]
MNGLPRWLGSIARIPFAHQSGAMDAKEKDAQAFTSSASSCIFGALPNRSCECMLCNKITKAVDAAFFGQPSDVGKFVAAY